MYELRSGDCVKWTRDGRECYGTVLSIGRKTACVEADGEELRVPIARLTYIPPLVLDSNTFKSLISLEGDILAILGASFHGGIVNRDGYEITVEDFVAALQRIKDGVVSEDAVAIWLAFFNATFFCQKWERRCTSLGCRSADIYTEDEALDMMNVMLCSVGGFSRDAVSEALEEGRKFLSDRNKPLLERRYPLLIKEIFLDGLSEDALLEQASEEHAVLYRLFAEELAAADNPLGLRAVGYGCYGGNRVFPCDWVRSRDCIARLFEIEEDGTKKAFLANTLGYIYYYGRCNGGIPEYEKAYRYFSFAAFNGVYEARYKIADMYKNGYGVVQSAATHDSIVGELYSENLRYIREGEYDCKFADVALRRGARFYECACEGDCSVEPLQSALAYYTEAEFAIRMRMAVRNYYGDEKVLRAITEGLARTREKIGFQTQKSIHLSTLLALLGGEVEEGRKLDLVIRQRSDGDYKMSFSPHRGRGKRRARKMFISVPEMEICGFFSKISVIYRARKPIRETLLGRLLTVDAMNYHQFLLDGEVIFQSDGDFVLRESDLMKGKYYRLVTVATRANNLITCLSADGSIAEGERVVVRLEGSEEEATVCRVSRLRECELPMPRGAYARVLRRA